MKTKKEVNKNLEATIELEFKERVKKNEEIASLRNTFKKLNDIANISSTNKKVEYLRENYNYDLYRILIFLLDKGAKTKITKTKINKVINQTPETSKDTLKQMCEIDKVDNIKIFDIITYLINAKGVKDNEIGAIQFYITFLPEDLQENVKSLIIKDFKINLGIKQVEKVFPLAFSEDNDMLILSNHQTQNGKAFEFDRTRDKEVTITEKIDGVRMNIYVKGDKTLSLTRQGKEKVFPEIEQELIEIAKKLNLEHVMFDGEVTYNFKNVRDFYEFLLKEEIAFVIAKEVKKLGLNRAKLIKKIENLEPQFNAAKASFDALNPNLDGGSISEDYYYLDGELSSSKAYLDALEVVEKSYFKTYQQLKDKIDEYKTYISLIESFDKSESITEDISKMCNVFRKDVFKITSGKINNKDFIGESGFIYNLFDIFFENEQDMPYKERRKVLNKVYNLNTPNINKPKVYLENDSLTEDKLNDILQNVKDYGKEGAMVNIVDAPYSYKTRGYNIMKIKGKETYDLKCIGYELSDVKSKKGKIAAYIVELFDEDNNAINIVKVAGLPEEFQEVDFFKKNVRGKIVEIEFTEISKNREGKLSLKHPRFIRIRDDKTEPSQN